MTTSVTGTFSGTGSSASIISNKVAIRLNFAGTASVDIEIAMPDGDWIKAVTGITADGPYVYDDVVPTAVRLTCTAHTNDVEYGLIAQ